MRRTRRRAGRRRSPRRCRCPRRHAPPPPAPAAADRHGNTSEAGSSTGIGVLTIADQAPCSAATTQPFLAANADGGDVSASSKRDAHKSRRSMSMWPRPIRASSSPGQDGVADRGAPQHASVTGIGVEVRQLADRTGRLHQRRLVVEVGEGHRRGPHQRAVAGGTAAALVQGRRLFTRGSRGDPPPARSRQYRAGLHTNVFGGFRPPVPTLDDVVQCLFVAQVRPGGRDLGDRDSHRRVVGPLPWLERSQAATNHVDRGVGGHAGDRIRSRRQGRRRRRCRAGRRRPDHVVQ